jgi:hypothetical protein
MRPNTMKAKLAAGEPALGLSVMIPSRRWWRWRVDLASTGF